MGQWLAATAKHLMYVGITVSSFLGLNWINELLFSRLDLTNGVTWVFMPAGVRLLSTLFFGLAGLEGMFLVGVYLNFHHFMFHSDYRSWSGAVAGALGPYLASLFAIHWFNLRSPFEELTPQRLLFTGLLCGVMSPIFHQAFVWVLTETVDWTTLMAMITGDTTGILIILFVTKGVIALNSRYDLTWRLVQRWPLVGKIGNRALLSDRPRW
jgi:H+/Cl- antiporter ClcA